VARPFPGEAIERAGRLFVVATPIGNLEDITARALRTLREADVIAAEDTRHTLKLLGHFGISKPLVSYWGEKEKAKAEEVMGHLGAGRSVALVSDAGTPGISDPGAVLVRRAIEEGVPVEVVPGPSAFVVALALSGLPTEEFTFLGFPPAKRGARERLFRELALEPRTLVFYESVHRVIESLIDMEAAFGADRRVSLSRELTKMYEETLRGTFREVLDALEADGAVIAGEYVVVVEGRARGAVVPVEEAVAEVRALMKKGKGRKEAVKAVAEGYGIQKKELYDLSLREDAE
jgi:16S rRNA (cytidine1402-2'-O)-methyltransferase